MKKRLLSISLALTMVLSLLPTVATAAESTVDPEVQQPTSTITEGSSIQTGANPENEPLLDDQTVSVTDNNAAHTAVKTIEVLDEAGLRQAVTQAQAEIVLKNSITLSQSLVIDQPVTIDGQKNTITGVVDLQNGTLRNVVLTAAQNNQVFFTIGSTKENHITMENVTVKYPCVETSKTVSKVLNGNNAAILINNCLFMNEGQNTVTENASEWSFGLSMDTQGESGSFTFTNNRFEGAFRTMLPSINGTVTIQKNTFVNHVYSVNVDAGGSGQEATCITTTDAANHDFLISGNTFDNAGAFYFQKTQNAKVMDNTFNFDQFEHFIQVAGKAGHPLNLTDNQFMTGSNKIVVIDVADASVVLPAGTPAVSYWAWADTPQESRPADYRSYVYEYNADGSRMFRPSTSAALNAFFNPVPGNIGVADGDIMVLEDDMEISTPIVIKNNVTLDLGNHTLTGNDCRVFHVKSGILNLTGNGTVTSIKPPNGTLVDTSSVIRVGDNSETKAAGLVIGKDVTIEAPDTYGVGAFGTNHGKTITVAGKIHAGPNAALGGNGSEGLGDTVFTVEPTAVLTSDQSAAIYHPQVGTLTIHGGTITGNTGIEMRAGSLTVNGGTITGGSGEPTADPNGNGTTSTNTGIAIVQHTTKKPIQVNINGGTISGGAAVYESNPQKNPADGSNAVSVNVQNTVLKGDVKADGFGSVNLNEVTVEGTVAQSGTGSVSLNKTTVTESVTKAEDSGSMGIVDSTIASGSAPIGATIVNSTVNGEMINTSPTEGQVAMVGSKTYATLQDAITAATPGDTVTLLADIDTLDKLNGSDPVSGSNIFLLGIHKSITINGNHKVISITMPETATNRSQALQITENTTVTLDGVKLDITGADRAADKGDAIDVYGTLKLANKSVITLSNVANGFVMQGGENAKVTVIGGSTITADGIKGHFSNGGIWEIKDSKVSIGNCGTHGLSVEKITVDNATVTVDQAGYTGIYASEITLLNNANVSVTNSATSPNLETNPAYQGKGAVQLKNDNGQLTVENSTLTLTGNGNGQDAGQQTIYVGEGTVTIENSYVTGEIVQTRANKYIVTVKNGDVVVKQEIVSGKYTLPDTPSKNGYTFLGWSDGSDTYEAGATVTITKNTIFTAQWHKDSSGSGGSSSSSGDYPVSVDTVKNGSVIVTPKRADKGDTVTVTVKADKGYVLNELVVTDKNGNAMKLKDLGNGKFSFTMPGSKVTVDASFKQVETALEGRFSDVTKSDYYYNAVLWAVDQGITSGTTATTFSPNASCTRAQMVTFLWRANGSPKAAKVNSFTDVSADAYYYDAVLWAAEKGITSGTTATTFSPDAVLTRAQTVTFLWRANGSPVVNYAMNFADVDGSTYYAEAVRWAVSEGITAGTSSDRFSPDADCTRAQIMTFMYRNAQ